MEKVTKDMVIAQVISMNDGIADILLGNGLHCIGCPGMQMESLLDAGTVHGLDVDKLVDEINDYLRTAN